MRPKCGPAVEAESKEALETAAQAVVTMGAGERGGVP